MSVGELDQTGRTVYLSVRWGGGYNLVIWYVVCTVWSEQEVTRYGVGSRTAWGRQAVIWYGVVVVRYEIGDRTKYWLYGNKEVKA